MVKEILELAGGIVTEVGVKRLDTYMKLCNLCNPSVFDSTSNIIEYSRVLVHDYMYGDKRVVGTVDGLLKVAQDLILNNSSTRDIDNYIYEELAGILLAEDLYIVKKGSLAEITKGFEFLYYDKHPECISEDKNIRLIYKSCNNKGYIKYYDFYGKILAVTMVTDGEIYGISPCGNILGYLYNNTKYIVYIWMNVVL